MVYAEPQTISVALDEENLKFSSLQKMDWMAWWWVNNQEMLILGWTIHLNRVHYPPSTIPVAMVLLVSFPFIFIFLFFIHTEN